MSIVVAGVLAVGVVFTVATQRRTSTTRLRLVHGVVSSESKAYFDDPGVAAAFAGHGLDVRIDTVGSDRLAATADLSNVDFTFLAGAPAAAKIASEHHITTNYVPFSTPIVVATFSDIAHELARAGVARAQGGTWTFDTKRYLELVQRRVRWNQLPGNTAYPANQFVFITSPGITTNTGAAYAELASYVANHGTVVDSPAQVDAVVNAVTPLFLEQGDESSSRAAPLVMTEEAQFLARAAAHDRSIRSNMVLMYPTPGVLARRTLVPLTPAGAELGQLLTTDSRLQHLAFEHGYRTTGSPALAAFAEQNHVAVPANVPSTIAPPTYDDLEALVTRVDAALLAALGPQQSTPATNASVPSPVPGTGPNRTGKP